MRGDLLDVILVIACVLFAFSGFRQGFLVGALSFVGIIGGGIVGVALSPAVVRALHGHLAAPVVGVLVVVVLAGIGQVLASSAGALLRRAITFSPARVVDSAAGAVLSVVSLLLVVWLVATSISHSSLTGIGRQIRGSAVIAGVDDVVPASLDDELARLRRALDNTGFPAVVGPLAGEPDHAVAAPDVAVLRSTAVASARGAIVKIRGDAPSCDRSVEGSGFLYASGRVMTNAHVLAGVTDPVVELPDGRVLRATVVYDDPDVDVAVLRVVGFRQVPLGFAPAVGTGASAVVAGYPENGPFRAVAARVRERQDVTGPNIYQTRTVTRQVYVLRASVLPGNSGGPLLAPDGKVYGVVFAASTDTAQTGYALSAAQVAAAAKAGAYATTPVGTGGCD